MVTCRVLDKRTSFQVSLSPSQEHPTPVLFCSLDVCDGTPITLTLALSQDGAFDIWCCLVCACERGHLIHVACLLAHNGSACRSLLPTQHRLRCLTLRPNAASSLLSLASTATLLTGRSWTATVTPWHSVRSLVSPTCRGYLHLERRIATRTLAVARKRNRQAKYHLHHHYHPTLQTRCLPPSSTERLPIQHGLSRTSSTFPLSAVSCWPLSSSGSSGCVLFCFVWRKWCKRRTTGR